MKCSHYIRFFELVCEECLKDKKQKQKIFPCHHCHNENTYHKIDRSKVLKMKCKFCNCIQPKNNVCINPECFKKEHRYTCLKCSLWTHKLDKIFHCDKCGICRMGDKDDYQHCDKCNLCWKKKFFDSHSCKFDQSDNDCAICMSSLSDNFDNPHILKCGHGFHFHCIMEYSKTNYKCPICKVTMGDQSVYWSAIDSMLENHQVPEEYQDWRVEINCCDCHKKSIKQFNLTSYYKCDHCGGYNTQMDNLIKPDLE